MTFKFFHFAPIRLREGSFIEPGNFGRSVSSNCVAQAVEGQISAPIVALDPMQFGIFKCLDRDERRVFVDARINECCSSELIVHPCRPSQGWRAVQNPF